MLKAIYSWVVRAWSKKPVAASAVQSTQSRLSGAEVHGAATAQMDAGVSVVSESGSGLPYDENLLEKAKQQWQRGDWDSLVQLPLDVLQHHPERAKLALLAAAGYAQKGQSEQARQFTKLAKEWGCSKKLISQILISGAYNSMGNAMLVAGCSDRALGHLQEAVALGVPNADLNLLAQVRAFPQLEKMGLSANNLAEVGLPDTRFVSQVVSIDRQLQPLQASVQGLAQTLQAQQVELAAQLKKQNDDLIAVRKFLDSSLKKEVANVGRQIEAYVAVQHYLATGVVSPEMHGWPISPDFALYLIDLIETRDYDLVIEFGSGVSTVLIAQALAKCRTRTGSQNVPVQVAFEHLEHYHVQTEAHLVRVGVRDAVQLVHAPLVDYKAPNGIIYSYYDCLKELSKIGYQETSKILVLVDGPPGTTGKHARYPALPVILSHFKKIGIDFLLDDYIRDDEKEIVTLWQQEILLGSRNCTLATKKLEKDACLLSIVKDGLHSH